MVLVFALITASCGADDEAADRPQGRGADLARAQGCSSCHGTEGQGGLGPPWQGLAGSEVELDDGSTVVADDEYLRRAIVDPGAQIRAGYFVPMPQSSLSEAEVDDLIAHIKSLG